MYILIYRSKSLTPSWTCSMVTIKTIPCNKCIDDDHTLFIQTTNVYINKISPSLPMFAAAPDYFQMNELFMFLCILRRKQLKISWTQNKIVRLRWKSIISLIHNEASPTQSHLNVSLATMDLIFISIDSFEFDHSCSECTQFSSKKSMILFSSFTGFWTTFLILNEDFL